MRTKLEARAMEREDAYERHFLEQLYQRTAVQTPNRERATKNTKSLTLDELISGIQEANLPQKKLAVPFLQYAKRDEDLTEDLAVLILNGERKNFKGSIQNQVQKFEYEGKKIAIKHHICRLERCNQQAHSTGIKRMDLRLKSIEPSIKAKFRLPQNICDIKIRDASGIKTIVDNYDSLISTLKTIHDKIGYNYEDGISQKHILLDIRVHNNAISKKDVQKLQKLGYNITNEINGRTYQAVHMNIQNGGSHNIAEVQLATQSMDNVNTRGSASHLQYSKQKHVDLQKYAPRGLEIISTYQTMDGQRRYGDAKITLNIESIIPGEAKKYALNMFGILYDYMSELEIKNTDDPENNLPFNHKLKYKRINGNKNNCQIRFYAPTSEKDTIMTLIDTMVKYEIQNKIKMNQKIIQKYNLATKLREMTI